MREAEGPSRLFRGQPRHLGDFADFEFEIDAGAPYRDFGLTDGLTAAGVTIMISTA